jgi:hypothetical protein
MSISSKKLQSLIGKMVEGAYPLVAETMMMIMITATTTPIMIIILMFCHQYFLFSLVA